MRFNIVVASIILAILPLTARCAPLVIEGFQIEPSASVAGEDAHLNGAGYRKVLFFRANVTALYAVSSIRSCGQLEQYSDAKRLEIIALHDLSGSQASRFFISLFEETASKAEFVKLIGEVAQIGDIYGGIAHIHKGDVLTLDWDPGKGLLAGLNGSSLSPHGAQSPYFKNPLLAQVLFRMYVCGKTDKELQENLLGNSTSMQK